MRDRGEVHLCSFCRASHKDVLKLIAGPDVNICDVCVDIFYEAATKGCADDTESGANPLSSRAECNFCGKRREEVEVLAGNAVYAICDECVSLCSEIVDEDDSRRNRPPRKRRPALPEDLWESIEQLAKFRVNTEPVFYIYVRLAVDMAKQDEFVKTWRRRLSVALILDGAKAVSYVYGGTSGSKARWAVIVHSNAHSHELGEATKCAVDKMHEAGILLRKAAWFFLSGACHSA